MRTINQRVNIGWWLLSLLVALNAVSFGQGRRMPGGQRPGPPIGQLDERRGPPDGRRPGPDFGPLNFEMFADSRIVKGAPYSATAVTETVQTLANGAKITNTKTSTVYRDSEGRTRREQEFDRVGPFSVGDEPRQIVFINDVVAGLRILLDPNRRTARKLPNGDNPPPRFGPPPFSSGDERKTEALGKQMIEGIEAEGTRTTVTIPTGKIGNDRPLEVISERWESPALQIVVASKHIDPFAGETTYRLTNLKREEPSRTLFEIPAEYTLEEDRPGRPGWEGRRKGPPRGFE